MFNSLQMIVESFTALTFIVLEMDTAQVQKCYFSINQGQQLCQSILSVHQYTPVHTFTYRQVFIEVSQF